MTYRIETTERFDKAFSQLDRYTQRMIKSWISKNLEGCSNPRTHGKPLAGNLKGLWRYRIGDYRLLCTIEDDKLIITAIRIDHRSSLYK